MIDVFATAAHSIALRSWPAPFFALTAGTLSSLGPCAAPRLLAIVSCTASARHARARVLSFCGGLIAAYASLGVITSLIARLVDIATWTYTALACVLLVGGIKTLAHADCATHEHEREHARGAHIASSTGIGANFLLGASFAFVIAPCCAPLAATIVAYTAQSGDPAYGALMLALFASGHSLPVALAGSCSARIADTLRKTAFHQAACIVSGTLMLALSALYWCLA